MRKKGEECDFSRKGQLKFKKMFKNEKTKAKNSVVPKCLIVGGGSQIGNFGKKTQKVHLIIIRK